VRGGRGGRTCARPPRLRGGATSRPTQPVRAGWTPGVGPAACDGTRARRP